MFTIFIRVGVRFLCITLKYTRYYTINLITTHACTSTLVNDKIFLIQTKHWYNILYYNIICMNT